MGKVETGIGWVFVIILLMCLTIFGLGVWAFFITLMQHWTSGC